MRVIQCSPLVHFVAYLKHTVLSHLIPLILNLLQIVLILFACHLNEILEAQIRRSRSNLGPAKWAERLDSVFGHDIIDTKYAEGVATRE